MVKDEHPVLVKEAIAHLLPGWLATFKGLLAIDPRQDIENVQYWDGLEVRIQVIRVRRAPLAISTKNTVG